VFVRPSLRRKGVGKALLNLLFKKLHSLGAEWVDVAPGGYDLPQEQQYAFYSSCGFEHDPKQEGRMVYYFKI
jgi:GNAT superfamily N-acetyltransferase